LWERPTSAEPDQSVAVPFRRTGNRRFTLPWRQAIGFIRLMEHEQECRDGDGPYGDDPCNQRPADKIAVVDGRPGSSHGDAAPSSDAGVGWGGVGDDDKTRAPACGRGHLDAMPEEMGGALYNE
jgi:hypothetical protein